MDVLRISCVGLDHRRTPVELRECVAFSAAHLEEALCELREFAATGQVAILATCNRTEVYAAAPRDLRPDVRRWLIQRSNGNGQDLGQYFYELSDDAAASHLCRVAAGIESQVVGESEILGQIKAAIRAARSAETLGPELEKLLLTAVRAGKRVRSETAIGQGAFSIGHCAVETATSVLGPLDGRVVLILGAGKMAESAASHLYSRGVSTILVANRTLSSAQKLAQQLGGRALRYDQLSQGLRDADIVIASTSAPHYVLLLEHLEEAMAGRNGRELLLIDIAVPRDIDPRVADIPAVHLCDIDDLNCEVRSAEMSRAGEVGAAGRIAREEASDFCGWLAAREGVPLLAALREHFEGVREEALVRFGSRVNRLSAEDRELLERVTESIVKRLLHNPTVNLKRELALGNGDAADLLARVYGLEPDRSRAAATASRESRRGQIKRAPLSVLSSDPDEVPSRGAKREASAPGELDGARTAGRIRQEAGGRKESG